VNAQLIAAIVAILTAAVVYTIAIFAERRAGVLKPWHLGMFVVGLIADTTGTTLMSGLVGGFQWNLHGILGVVAIALMLLHASWAAFALWRKQESLLANFHKFSISVWGLWMLSLVTGFGISLRGMLG